MIDFSRFLSNDQEVSTWASLLFPVSFDPDPLAMIASFLGRLFFGPAARPVRRSVPRGSALRFTPALEGRTLLAGNVTATVVDGLLQITGDAAANDIQILETAAGVIVRGQNATTINGVTTDFVAFAATLPSNGPIEIRLGAGNDKVLLNGFQMDGALACVGGSGNDRLTATAMTFAAPVVFVGGAGDDAFYAEASEFQRVVALTGNGNDLVSLSDCEITGSLIVAGRQGDDQLALDATTVERRLIALMNQGDDEVLLDNGTETKRVYVWGGRGDDLVQADDSDTSKSFVARMWHGDDTVSFVGDVDVGQRLFVRGRGDNDSFDNGTGTLPENAFIIGMEEDTTPDSADDRIDALREVIADLQEELLPLTATVTGTGLVQSSGVQISTNAAASVNVTGIAGRTVEIDTDGDGFDDGTVVLNASGTGTLPVTLTHTDANQGLNTIRVRQMQGSTPLGSTESVRVHFATGRVVRMATTEGNVDIELLNTDAPNTVANFLTYLTKYEGSIIHRSARSSTGGDFIIQGGGFDLNTTVVPIVKTDDIDTEFLAKNSNLRGTLSMALPGGNPNGGTSEWFINTANNSGLDGDKHTVFGRVIGDGMTVVDAIHDLAAFNIVAATDLTALSDVPLKSGYAGFTGTLTGTISTISGNAVISGTNTKFLTELTPGANFRVGGVVYTVGSITSDISLTLKVQTTASATVTNQPAQVNVAPTTAQYVRVNTVTTIANG